MERHTKTVKPYVLPTIAWMMSRISRPVLRVLIAVEQDDLVIASGVSQRNFNLALRWECIEIKTKPIRGLLTLRGEQLLRELRKDATHSAHIDNLIAERAAEKNGSNWKTPTTEKR